MVSRETSKRNWRLAKHIAGVCVSGLLLGCDSSPPPAAGALTSSPSQADSGPPTSPESAVAPTGVTGLKTPAEIEALWRRRESLIETTDPKARYGESSEALQAVLRDDCSQAERDLLLEYAVAAPAGNEGEDFPCAVICGLVFFYAVSGERDSLVTVLAHACPRKVGLQDPEVPVVLTSRGIDDPVTVLFDAYVAATSVDAKATLAGAVRRGFTFTGDLPADDDLMVVRCREWYDRHRTEVVPNLDYVHNAHMGGPADRWQTHGLFKPKP